MLWCPSGLRGVTQVHISQDAQVRTLPKANFTQTCHLFFGDTQERCMLAPDIFQSTILPDIPDDCKYIIDEFLPSITEEFCYVCGLPLVMKDRRNRLHFHKYIICTESVIVCTECFECFYA